MRAFRRSLDSERDRSGRASITLVRMPTCDERPGHERTTARRQAVHDRLAEIQLVDCRELYEWHAGRIDGAVHLP